MRGLEKNSRKDPRMRNGNWFHNEDHCMLCLLEKLAKPLPSETFLRENHAAS